MLFRSKIVELAAIEDFFAQPRHPYSKALLSAVPVPDVDVERSRRRIVLSGDLPSPAHVPSGCRFRTRCPYVQPVCAEREPALESDARGHAVACHFSDNLQTAVT